MATVMSKRKAPEAVHASYAEMVSEAISQLKKRNGSSRSAIANHVKAHNDLGSVSPKVITANLRRALSTGVENSTLLISKNNGPSAYYKLADKKAKKAAEVGTTSSGTSSVKAKKAESTKKTAKKADGAVSKKAAKATTAKQGDAAVPAKKARTTTSARADAGATKKTTKAATKAKKNDVAVSKKAAKADTGASKETTKAAASAKVAESLEKAMRRETIMNQLLQIHQQFGYGVP